MKTRSAHKQENETRKGIGEDIFILTDQAVSNKKSTEGIGEKEERKFEGKAVEEISSSSCDEIEVLFDKKHEVHPVKTLETTVIVNKEDNQSQQFHSPIFNIHIHVSPSNNDNSSVPATVQPIIHVHFDESIKNHGIESVSSQNSMIKRVESLLSITSTDSGNMSTGFSNSSVIVNNTKENNYTSPNQNGIRQKNGTDVDMSDLSNISSNEISTDWHVRNVTRKQVPDINVVKVEEPTSQKRHKSCVKKSNSSDRDKDFESVIPKLQEKLDNLIKKNLQNANTRTYKKIKEKLNSSKNRRSMQYHEDNTSSRQLRSKSSNETPKLKDSAVIEDTEVIVLSDSDSPTAISNKEEIVEEKKKEKKKSNIKNNKTSQSCEQLEDVNSSEDEGGRYNLRKQKSVTRNDELKKEEKVRTREIKDRKCKTPVTEQHMNWVKKVAFAKAFDLQPTVFAEKEILVKSPVQPNKSQDSNSTSQISVKRNEKTQQSDSIVSCETPKRHSSYQHVNKHLSKEISDVESSPKALGSPNKRHGSKDQVSDSGKERDEEILNSKKAQELRNKSKTSSVSVNNNEETQQNDSLVSCQSPDRLSYGCQSLPSGFAGRETIEKSPVNSRKAKGLKNKSETSSVSVISNEEVEEYDRLVSCETPKRFSNASQFQSSVFAEKGILEKSPVNSKTPQELKSIWQTAFASVDRKKEPQQNGSLVSCQTPKWVSSQHPTKRGSEVDVESSPKVLRSSNNKQESKDEVSASANERDEVICTSAQTPNREENSESGNNKRYMTLLAEGCNFSEILLKFREKHYKDMVKVLFPDKSGSNNNNHIPKDSNCSAKESVLEEDELKNRSPPGDGSNVSTVKQKKAKEKSDKFKNENEADENSNPFLSPKELVKCFSSPTEKSIQRTHPPVSPQVKESLNETSVINVSVTSHTNEIHLCNEVNLNCDGGNVPGSKNFEKITGGITINESCNNSSSTGNGTTPENKVILQNSSHESHECMNEFRAIKKKLRALPCNNLLKPDLEKNNDIQSKSQLENLRKDLFNKCMAQNSSDIKQAEKTDSKLRTKRKGSPESSNLGKSPPSAKKMKRTKGKKRNSKKTKTPRKKGSSGEDYIPLNASGPTKFAVAPLDKVTPYRGHAAKDFKANVLYGKRVTRFNSPKSLETYKTKQKARKKSYC